VNSEKRERGKKIEERIKSREKSEEKQ